MADFIDDEASEASSSNEEELEDEEVVSRKSGKKTKAKKRVREFSDSSEEEEEDDEEAAEEMKDLINDEEEEEEDEDSDDDDRGAKRSRDSDTSSSASLEEEDYDLVQENTGVRLDAKKKFKRIKTLGDDDSDEEIDEGRKIQNELFGPTDLLDSDDEDVNKQRSRPKDQDLSLALDDDEDDSDSEDNFIVDDHDQPIHKKTKKKGARYTDSAMQQAQDIFGVDFDFEDAEDDDGYEDEEDYEEDYDEDNEEGAQLRQRKKKGGRKTIHEVFEPSELERSHMTSYDQQIRAKDEPERFQLRSVPITEADEEELEQESNWIWDAAFNKDRKTISIQEVDRGPIAGGRSKVVMPEIQYALQCIRNEKLEVPFIAAYRREYVPSISSNFDDTRDLWTIYRYDEQWCKLRASKTTIRNLYKDMREYIEKIDPDNRIRKITDEDILNVDEAKDFHDLEDCRTHFKLYYSALVPKMKLGALEKKMQTQQESRRNKAKKKNRVVTEDEAANGLEDRLDDAPDDGPGDEVDNEPGDRPDDERDDALEDGSEEETEEEKLYKRLSKFKISSKDNYQKCREDYIGELVEKFGLTAEEFGVNLRDDFQRNTVRQNVIRPLDEAANCLRPGIRFHDRDSILKAAVYMYSREISCDPIVRRTVRKHYFEDAVINVKPTAQGMREIDENHPCYPLKFLKNKPVNTLVGENFLNILNAERDKLLEVKFSIEAVDTTDPGRATVSTYYESLRALYFADYYSTVIGEWNEKREEAVCAALSKFLLPCIEKQLRDKLIKEAQDKIIKTSSEKLHEWLNVAPYAPSIKMDEHEDFELRNGTRICGFTFAPEGDAPCFAAIVDSEGELLDHVRLPYLNIRKRPDRMNALEKENHQKDRVKFKEFVLNKKPHVIALAAETIQTKYICQDLATILDELKAADDSLPLIPIEIMDTELSSVYMNLKRATAEFPEFPPLLLQAISTARKLNDPLTEYAKLCTPDDDILCIRFHTLQDDIPKEELLTSLNQTYITRTNAVGVDINRAITHPHTADLVQFIAGLGPRKGAHLIRSIKRSSTGGQLVSRQQLVKELGMTSVIFINCAGFIKLDTDTLTEYYPEEHITPLDSTRIHPQSYGLAKKIANDALDRDEDSSDELTASSIEEIFDSPIKLEDLDLGAFALELEEVQKQGKKGFTLQNIREEIGCRYKDHREPYRPPSQEEIFAMLTKETPHTFYKGKLITCQVVQIPRKKPSADLLERADPVKIDDTNLWRCPFCLRGDFQDLSVVWNHFDTNDCPGYAVGVRCRLDNGLFGFISTDHISDHEVSDPSNRVAIGQTIHARVVEIDAEKFSCRLSCKTSDLVDATGTYKPAKDEHYDEMAEVDLKRELEAKSKRAVRRPYCKRVIVHPAFENIDFKACEKKLKDMEQGHAIIRPSSAGQNYLTVSWKVTNDINQHVTIREEGKANAFSLGHQLYIENESYEDLDEIIARYIQPMASYARELLNYKYCLALPGGIDEEQALCEIMKAEKKKNPSTIPYRFTPSRNMPGKFLFGYIPSDKPMIEYLTITPAGYRFRKQIHRNLALLIKWFKENYKNRPQILSGVTPGMGYDGTNPLASLRQTFPMSQ